MPNVFDQFDTGRAATVSIPRKADRSEWDNANPFDAFSDAPEMGNPFDSFDAEQPAQPTRSVTDTLKREGRSVLEAPVRFERGIAEKVGDVASGGARLLDVVREGDLLAGSPKPNLTIMQHRRAYEQAMRDPRYMERVIQAGDDPSKLRQVESTLGPAAKLDVIQTPEKERARISAEDAVARQARLETDSPLYQWGREQIEFAGKVFKGSPDIDDTFVSGLAQSAGGVLPDLALSAVPAVGPTLAAGSYALQSGEQQAQEAIAANKPEAADIAFVSAAGLAGLSERLLGFAPRFWSTVKSARLARLNPAQFGNVWEKWAAANPIKARILEGGAREGVQEGTEQGGQNLIASDVAGYDPNRPVTQGVGKAALTGAVLGGIVGGGAEMVGRAGQAENPSQPSVEPNPFDAFQDAPQQDNPFDSFDKPQPSEAQPLDQPVIQNSRPVEAAAPATSPGASQAATFADGTTDPVQTALNKMREAATPAAAEVKQPEESRPSKPEPDTKSVNELDTAPATKADLKALADFIESGGPNPFAAKVEPKPTNSETGVTTKNTVAQSKPVDLEVLPAQKPLQQEAFDTSHYTPEQLAEFEKWKRSVFGDDSIDATPHGKLPEAVKETLTTEPDLKNPAENFNSHPANDETLPLDERLRRAGIKPSSIENNRAAKLAALADWKSKNTPAPSQNLPSQKPAKPFKAGDRVTHDGKTKIVARMSADGSRVVLGKRSVPVSEVTAIAEQPQKTGKRADVVYEGGPANRVRQSPPNNTKRVMYGPKGQEFAYVDSGRTDSKGARVFVPEKAGTSRESTPKDKVEEFLTKAIEATELKQGELLEGVTGAPVWLTKAAANGVLRVVRAAYHATKNVAQAIQAGLTWLQEQKLDGFNEQEARGWLDKLANDERAATNDTEATESSRPERERSASAVKTELDEAESQLREQTRASSNLELRKGKTKAEHRQELSLATARYRTLRDELLHHPEYVAEQITKQHAAITEANDMLKPHDMAVHPESFPSGAKLHEVLSPEQFSRIKQLQNEIETAYAEIARMPKKLVARVQSEMEHDGRLPKPKPLVVDAGRSLEKVTEWLRSKDIASPDKSLAQRLNLGARFVDTVQNAKTSLQKARITAKGVWKAAVESYKAPPKDDDFRHVIKSWIYADQRTGLATHQFVKELVAKIPTTDRRKGISVWLDADGDAGLLRAQMMQVPESYRGAWRAALNLTPDEQSLALKIKQDFADKLDDGVKVGLIDQGREDYGVPQRWKIKPEIGSDQQAERARKGTPGRIEAKLDARSPFFSFQREVPSYFDGVMAGGVPENLDIAHLVATYDAAFHKSLSSRGMIAALQEAKAKDGLPIVKISGNASSSNNADGKAYFVDSKAWSKSDVSEDGRPYRSLDHSALKGWKLAFKDDSGNPIIVKGDMLIHPDHFAYLKNELGQSALREVPIIKGFMQSQAFLKASKLSASFFHLVTIGEHMASHLVNPFLNGFKIDLRSGDQQLLVRNGLELGMSYPQMAYEEGLASAHSGLFNKIPGLGDLSAKVTDWMFKDYIPAIMMKAGLHALENNRKRYGDKLTPDQVAELTAMQMNAAGGLLNYRLRGAEGNMWGRLGANKTWMDIQRLALLAPQFLEARARVVGQALKPYGMEQRKMLIMQAGILWVGARILNQLLDDDPHWGDNPFSVVYKGRAYSIRTIVGDFWHLLTDPNSFAAGRLSPLGRVAIEDVVMNGRDLRTGARKETPIETHSPIGRFAQNLVVDIANWLTPITVEGMLPGSTGREQTLTSMALSSLGVGSRKYTALGQVYDMAAQFNRKSDDPKTRNYQSNKEGGTFPASDYRKLDSLLDAGEIEKAKQEIKALQKEGKTEEIIRRRYSRATYFTGSQEREEKFKASLSEREKKIYQEALKEKELRAAALEKALTVRR